VYRYNAATGLAALANLVGGSEVTTRVVIGLDGSLYGQSRSGGPNNEAYVFKVPL
jgi:hypothetical protein